MQNELSELFERLKMALVLLIFGADLAQKNGYFRQAFQGVHNVA